MCVSKCYYVLPDLSRKRTSFLWRGNPSGYETPGGCQGLQGSQACRRTNGSCPPNQTCRRRSAGEADMSSRYGRMRHVCKADKLAFRPQRGHRPCPNSRLPWSIPQPLVPTCSPSPHQKGSPSSTNEYASRAWVQQSLEASEPGTTTAWSIGQVSQPGKSPLLASCANSEWSGGNGRGRLSWCVVRIVGPS